MWEVDCRATYRRRWKCRNPWYGYFFKYRSERGDIRLFASLTPASSTPEQYFNASAVVNPDLTATISPEQYWPALLGASMKFFSWYPYSGTGAPTANFSNPGQMVLNYTANTDAANHVDVLAAISEPAWSEGVSIHFYHTLTKVTFTFKKVDPVPDVVTIER